MYGDLLVIWLVFRVAPIAAVDISLHVLQSLEHTVVQECKAEFEALFHAFQQVRCRIDICFVFVLPSQFVMIFRCYAFILLAVA